MADGGTTLPGKRTGRRRALVLVLGVAAAVSVAGVLVLAREIVIRSHVGRLEEDPSHFEELLRRSDGFAVRGALERYVATDGGRRAFVRKVLALGAGEGLEKWFNRQGRGERALIRLTEHSLVFEPGLIKGGLGEDRSLPQLVSLLPLLEESGIVVDEYPQVTFTLLEQTAALRVFWGHDRGKSESLPAHMFVVELRKDG